MQVCQIKKGSLNINLKKVQFSIPISETYQICTFVFVFKSHPLHEQIQRVFTKERRFSVSRASSQHRQFARPETAQVTVQNGETLPLKIEGYMELLDIWNLNWSRKKRYLNPRTCEAPNTWANPASRLELCTKSALTSSRMSVIERKPLSRIRTWIFLKNFKQVRNF